MFEPCTGQSLYMHTNTVWTDEYIYNLSLIITVRGNMIDIVKKTVFSIVIVVFVSFANFS